jgi:hypothetical protein
MGAKAMLKAMNKAKKLQNQSVFDDAKLDTMLETLASCARPDLSRLRRGVERSLVTGYTSRRQAARFAARRRVWAVALTAACLLGLASVLVLRDSRAPALILLALGDTTVTEDGKHQVASQSQPLRYGSTVESTKGGMATLLLSDLSRVRMAQSTCLRLEGRRDLSLEYGSLFVEVTPLKSAVNEFCVRAGQVLVTVRGTSFELSRSENVVDVAVVEGTVQVEAGRSSVLLRRGETIRFDSGGLGAQRPIDPAAIAAWRKELLAAEADNPTIMKLMRTHFPSRSLDAPKM